MNHVSVCVASLAMLACTLPAAVTTFAIAQPADRHGIELEHGWARATPGLAHTGAAYLNIVNKGDSPDRLIGMSSPVAEKAEAHESKMENGVMTMRPLGPLTIDPGKAIEFKPSADHIMLMGLKHPLKQGESFPLTLTFEKSGEIQIIVRVARVGASAPEAMGDTSGDHDRMKMKE